MTLTFSAPVTLGNSGLTWNITDVTAINDQDQVIGTTLAGNSFVWQDGVFLDLFPYSGDTEVVALGINNAGLIVGGSTTSTTARPVYWTSWDYPAQLTALSDSGRAFAVNNQSMVVGSSRDSHDLDVAFSEVNGVVTELPTLPGGGTYNATLINSRALAVNDSGQIVGFGLTTGDIYHAALWQNGAVTDLGTIAGGGKSEALAINNGGTIVGFAVDSAGIDEAISWQNGTMTVLPHLQYGGHTVAYGINNAGLVVGRSDLYTASGWTDHAVLWQNGTLFDLNNDLPANSGWVLNYAFSINNNGEIVGMGTYDGAATAFMMAVGDSGAPAMSVSAALGAFKSSPHSAALSIADGSATIVANLASLESIAAAGKLLQLHVTDAATPTLTTSYDQLTADAALFDVMTGSYNLNVTGLSEASAAIELTSPHVTEVGVADISATISSKLDLLQSWASAGELSGITFTDSSPTLFLSVANLQNDGKALAAIQGAYSIDLDGVTAAQALFYSSTPHLGELDVTDTAANIAKALPQLSALGVTLSLTVTDSSADISANYATLMAQDTLQHPIVFNFTDSGLPVLAMTADEESLTSSFLATMKNSFEVLIDASKPNTDIHGIGLLKPTVASFPDAASAYTITSANVMPILSGFYISNNDGTSKDYVTEITALKFADGTYFVAHTPVAGQVNSGTIAELYSAVLARVPDVQGLQFYEEYTGSASSLNTLASYFLNSAEYKNNPAHNYAQSAAGDAQFIVDTYQNLLHRAPDSGATAFYQSNVINPMLSGLTPGTSAYAAAQVQAHAQVLVYFASSQEFLGDVQITAQHPADAQHWLYLI